MHFFFKAAPLCLLTTISHAQTTLKAGTVQLGGTISYSQDKSTTSGQYDEYQTFYIAPAVGYFVLDNLAVGINGNFSAGTNNSSNATYSSFPSSRETHTKGYEIGPFVQYYRMLSEKFGITGWLGANYLKTTSTYTAVTNGIANSGDTAGDGFYARLTPSIIFFPVSSLGISASIGGVGYSHNNAYKTDYYNGNGNSTSFGASFGLSQLAFSGAYYFGR